jgi:hypothetical protein
VYPIPAVKKYSDWKNAVVGLRYKIHSEIRNETKGISRRIKDCGCSPEGMALFDAMLSESISEWKETEQYVDNQMSTYMTDYGLAEVEAWELMGKGLREIFVYLREFRSIAQDLLTNCTDKADQFSLAMWACLQAHRVMQEYAACGYIGHHTLALVRAEHLLTHRVSPQDLKVFGDRVTTIHLSIAGLTLDVDALLVHNKLTSKRKRKP